MSAPWSAVFHRCVNPDALVAGYWMVTDGKQSSSMPDEVAAREVVAFFNRLVDLGYPVDVCPRLVGPSWVEVCR